MKIRYIVERNDELYHFGVISLRTNAKYKRR